LRAEKSEIEDFADRKCRLARDGGWFSYEMTVAPADPVALIATYWGGVWHRRKFDISIDDEEVDTQELLLNKPGEFFDHAYSIPFELTRDKAKVTVRFQSHVGDIAGGVFRLRMMKARAAPTKGVGSTGVIGRLDRDSGHCSWD
jgi:uncharacterized protein